MQRQPGANVIATVNAIKAQLPELQKALPTSVNVSVLADRTTGIRASVEHIEIELVLVHTRCTMIETSNVHHYYDQHPMLGATSL